MQIGDIGIDIELEIGKKKIVLSGCWVYNFYFNLNCWLRSGSRKNMHYEANYDFMGEDTGLDHFCIDPVGDNKYVISDCKFVQEFPKEGLSDGEMRILCKCLEKEVIKLIEEKYKEKEKIEKAKAAYLCYPADEDAPK